MMGAAMARGEPNFWNKGGGAIIIGINDDGNIDGGIPLTIGRQDLSDWVDQIIHQHVEPVGRYERHIIQSNNPNSAIQQGNGVLVVSFDKSENVPHMGSNNQYYVRTGAHSRCSRSLYCGGVTCVSFSTTA